MTPFDLTRLVVDSSKIAFSGKVVIGASPAVWAILRLEEIDSISIVRANEEQS